MGSNSKTDVAAAAQATPRVGTRLLLATTNYPNFFNLFFFFNLPLNSKKNNCQDGRVQDQAELPRGLRGIDQQEDQHGILCLVRLSFHEFLLQPGRPSPPRICCSLPRVRVPGRAGGGHQGHRGPDHQDEESRRRTWPAFDRQGDGILNLSNTTQNLNWQQLLSLIGFEINYLLFVKKKKIK